jgi:hypothetical protein
MSHTPKIIKKIMGEGEHELTAATRRLSSVNPPWLPPPRALRYSIDKRHHTDDTDLTDKRLINQGQATEC